MLIGLTIGSTPLYVNSDHIIAIVRNDLKDGPSVLIGHTWTLYLNARLLFQGLLVNRLTLSQSEMNDLSGKMGLEPSPTLAIESQVVELERFGRKAGRRDGT